MNVSPNLAPTLQTIVTATRSPMGYMYINPKSPVVSALAKQGFIEINDSMVDPMEPAKRAAKASTSGLGEFPASEPVPAFAQPPVDTAAAFAPQPGFQPAAQPGAWTGAPVAQDGSTPATAVLAKAGRKRGPSGPRIAPQIVHSAGPMGLPVAAATKRGGNTKEVYPFTGLAAPVAGADGSVAYHSFFIPATDVQPAPFKTVRSAVASANKRFEPKAMKFQAFDVALDVEHNHPGVRVFRIK